MQGKNKAAWINIMKLGFQTKYFLAFIVLFLLEAVIAVYIHDQFIRPFVGDALVVVLLFCFFRAFYSGKHPLLLALGVFGLACLVEVGQYFNLLALLHLQNSRMASLLLGSTFDWRDILAYACGGATILLGQWGLERRFRGKEIASDSL